MRRLHKRILWSTLALIAIVLLVIHFLLDAWLTRYVNRVLADLNGYHGSVENVGVRLYRGAYKIEGLVITKSRGKFDAPFIEAQTVDLSLQWGALLHGRIVSDIHINRAEITFAVDRSGRLSQTGKEIDWTNKVKDLMPIDINEVTFSNSKLAYRDFSSTPKVNIYVTNMSGKIDNLRNVVEADKPLPSRFEIAGDSIGKGRFHSSGHANILKQIPDLDLEAKLENVNLPAINSYSNAYGAIDFEKGQLSIYSELVVKNGKLTGYVKPIATDISMINIKHSNPFKIVWETVVATLVQIFKNQPQDQFATKVPLSGDLNHVQTDTWATLANIFHNAFVQAFAKKVDNDTKF